MKILFVEPEYLYKGIFSIEAGSNVEFEYNGYKLYSKGALEFSRYDAVVSMQYLWPLSNVVILKAKKFGVPTYLITDGIIEWENCYSHRAVKKSKQRLFSVMFHDYIVCPGIFEGQFINERQINLSYLPKKVFPEVMNSSRKKNSTKVVLVTTANTAYFNDGELIELARLINEILDYQKKSMEKFEVKLRVFDEALLARLNMDGFENDIESSFNELINDVDALITTPSTIVLTSMLNDIATCQLIYRNSPMFVQSGWMYHGSCDFEYVINGMLNRDAERLAYQRKVLKENYPSSDLSEIILNGNSCFSKRSTDSDESEQYLNMLESPFNLNVEYFIRKVHRKVIKIKKRLKV